MDREHEIRVADRPERPLVVFDGDCGFCRQWVDRWRRITGGRADFLPYEETADRFPEVGRDRFRRRVWLIAPDGRASGGFRAVLGVYGLFGEKRWLAWLYERVPPFAAVGESGYDFVAAHRDASEAVVRLLWGDVTQRPRYARMRAIFLRAMGLVYLSAFLSLAVQVDGLIGSRGILPASEFIGRVKAILGPSGYTRFPTLLWWDASDAALQRLCWGGAFLSVLLTVGVLPRLCLALLWAFYLSLTVAGQDFLSFQWDMLLLESGLLAVWLAPGGLWLRADGRDPPRSAVWLFHWLVFRLMLLAGLVKLTSRDPTWRTWEALQYHYETQPLPTWTSWYMHQLPSWFQSVSVGFMFWAELIAPFFVFAPRRLRLVGFFSFVTLQVLIASTGNYGFFNVLSVVLCLTLIEDRDWGRKWDRPEPVARRSSFLFRVPLAAFAAVALTVTTMEAADRSGLGAVVYPEALEDLREAVAPLRSFNSYGLFAVMTTERPEITVEGSDDGRTWLPYRFRYKPGEPGGAPRFTTPHMPRLDWQMWFAALGRSCRGESWFLHFEQRLLEGSPEVLALLRENPFPDRPPKYLRARLSLYTFTRGRSKDWWAEEDAGLFCPLVALPSAQRTLELDWRIRSGRSWGRLDPDERGVRIMAVVPDQNARTKFLDKATVQRIVAEVNRAQGFHPDPGATPARARALMRARGVRAEDCLFSRGIIEAREE